MTTHSSSNGVVHGRAEHAQTKELQLIDFRALCQGKFWESPP